MEEFLRKLVSHKKSHRIAWHCLCLYLLLSGSWVEDMANIFVIMRYCTKDESQQHQHVEKRLKTLCVVVLLRHWNNTNNSYICFSYHVRKAPICLSYYKLGFMFMAADHILNSFTSQVVISSTQQIIFQIIPS